MDCEPCSSRDNYWGSLVRSNPSWDDGRSFLVMVDQLSQDSSWSKSRLTPITTAFTRTTKAGLKDHNSPQWNAVLRPCEKLHTVYGFFESRYKRQERSSKTYTRTPRWRPAEYPPKQRMDLVLIEFKDDLWNMSFFCVCVWQWPLHYIQYNLNIICMYKYIRDHHNNI